MFIAAGILFTASFADATNLWWVKGGNWADSRDNYNTGWVIPSGLTSSETVAGAKAKADQIASNIKYVSGNMVRVPINPPTVASSYWTIVQAYVNELIADGLYVDLCCWTEKSSVGTVDDLSAWETMWETVDSVYSGNWNVFYEPINEPYGYTSPYTGLKSLYSTFLGIVAKSQQRILLDGTGYADHLSAIGSDSAFNGCDLALHIYPYWDNYTTVGSWETALNNRIGGYQSRATITEMGAYSTNPTYNYQTQNSGNRYISFIQGVGQEVQTLQIGLVYWPMWKDGDNYRLFVNTDSGSWVNWSLMEELTSLW